MSAVGSPAAPVAVLMYHDVVDTRPGRAFRRYVVPPSLLDEHLDALAVAGYRTARASELVAGSTVAGDTTVVLTFDDAFASFASAVMPMIAAKKMCATVFVPTAYVGGTTEWLAPEGEGDRKLLDWPDLRDALAQGIEVGSHGHRHLEFDSIGLPELREELADSRKALEDRLGAPVSSLAYPFGYNDRAVREATREAGYLVACEVGYGLQPPGRDPLRVRRLLVGPDTTPEELLALVSEGRTTLAERARRAGGPAWRTYRRLLGARRRRPA